jgi:hypothetical protein
MGEREQDIYNETHLLMKRYEHEHTVILDKRTRNSKLECLVQWIKSKKKIAEWVPYQKIKVILQKPLYEYDKKHGLLGDDELEEDSDDSDIDEDEEDDEKIFDEMNKRKQQIHHDIEVEKKQKLKLAQIKSKKKQESERTKRNPKPKAKAKLK